MREPPSPSPLSPFSFPLFVLGFALLVFLERGKKSKNFVVYLLRFGVGKEARFLLVPSGIHHILV
jgi:hypothetical protein